MPQNGPRPTSGDAHLRLTQRGKVVLAATVVLALLLLFSLLRSCGVDEPEAAVPAAGDRTTSAQPTPGPSASSSSTPPSPSGASSTPSASPSRTPSMAGIVTSKDRGSREWRTASLDVPTTHAGRARPHRYVVKLETNLDLDVTEVARQVQRVLDDERSWVGSTGNSFSLVSDESTADLTIFLASPDTTDAMCKPLDVRATWSCKNGKRVILNADRWRYRTPTWQQAGSDEYRAYMVNHEVGHYIGMGHVGCPASGSVAPVMMQQSIRLDGCTINAWPSQSKGR